MKKRVIAMDMDGTITQHKSLLEIDNRSVLEKLREKYQLVVVGAGSCERIKNQLQFEGLDIVGNYGMQMAFYEQEKWDWKVVVNEQRPYNEKSILKRMDELRKMYGYETYIGKSVEFHESGVVTLPLIGTAAKLEDKLAFDPDRIKRRAIYKEVVELFGEYTVFIGGTSSYDMVPEPFDKYYALVRYAEMKKYSKKDIVYVGDDYGLGGNDSQIYNSDITFLTIDDYRKFPEVVQGFL